jgi:hypothetical protein
MRKLRAIEQLHAFGLDEEQDTGHQSMKLEGNRNQFCRTQDGCWITWVSSVADISNYFNGLTQSTYTVSIALSPV